MNSSVYNDDVKNTLKDNSYKTEVKALITRSRLL